jgi:hypothetical protein
MTDFQSLKDSGNLEEKLQCLLSRVFSLLFLLFYAAA